MKSLNDLIWANEDEDIGLLSIDGPPMREICMIALCHTAPSSYCGGDPGPWTAGAFDSSLGCGC